MFLDEKLAVWSSGDHRGQMRADQALYDNTMQTQKGFSALPQSACTPPFRVLCTLVLPIGCGLYRECPELSNENDCRVARKESCTKALRTVSLLKGTQVKKGEPSSHPPACGVSGRHNLFPVRLKETKPAVAEKLIDVRGGSLIFHERSCIALEQIPRQCCPLHVIRSL